VFYIYYICHVYLIEGINVRLYIVVIDLQDAMPEVPASEAAGIPELPDVPRDKIRGSGFSNFDLFLML
jgi:hypothetical protein